MSLKSIRENTLDMTVREMAEALGVSKSWISRLERGESQRLLESIPVLTKIADAYGIDVEAIPRLTRPKEG